MHFQSQAGFQDRSAPSSPSKLGLCTLWRSADAQSALTGVDKQCGSGPQRHGGPQQHRRRRGWWRQRARHQAAGRIRASTTTLGHSRPPPGPVLHHVPFYLHGPRCGGAGNTGKGLAGAPAWHRLRWYPAHADARCCRISLPAGLIASNGVNGTAASSDLPGSGIQGDFSLTLFQASLTLACFGADAPWEWMRRVLPAPFLPRNVVAVMKSRMQVTHCK